LAKEIEKELFQLQKLGVKEGDLIITNLPTSSTLVNLLFASMHIGAIFFPLNPRWPNLAVQEMLAQFSPTLFVSSSGMEKRVAQKTTLSPSSVLVSTSGSTGKPKIASISQTCFFNNAKSAMIACDLKNMDGWRLSLPMHHVAGLSIVFRTLLAGARLIFDEKDLTTTHLSQVPAQLYLAWPIYPKLRCVLLGGGPITEVPKELPCLISYAMTEMASLIMTGRSPNTLRPVENKEVKLASDGEILVRGDSLFEGYWDGKVLHKPFDQEGWFSTKDLGHYDPTFGYSIVGRKDNQFVSGGENIQPEEIEKELLKIPGILEALVGPRTHERFGKRPIAYIKQLNGPIDTVSLQKELSKSLPNYKIPDAFFPLEEEPFLKRNRKKIFDDSK